MQSITHQWGLRSGLMYINHREASAALPVLNHEKLLKKRHVVQGLINLLSGRIMGPRSNVNGLAAPRRHQSIQIGTQLKAMRGHASTHTTQGHLTTTIRM
jgi:hypothetical protein